MIKRSQKKSLQNRIKIKRSQKKSLQHCINDKEKLQNNKEKRSIKRRLSMSLINKEVNDFSVQAFWNNDFQTVTKEDILGKWSVFFFYPADFTFSCPTE